MPTFLAEQGEYFPIRTIYCALAVLVACTEGHKCTLYSSWLLYTSSCFTTNESYETTFHCTKY